MASTAISAQGSTIDIGTGTGGAKTITGVAAGYPTIITSTAHGLSNGDVVTIASVGGITTMNSSSYVISNVTTNTFAVEANTVGGTYTSGGTATPVTWTEVANVKTFSGFDGEAAEIDVTNLSSTAKEFRTGLQDFGSFSFDWDVDYANAGQNAVRAAQASGSVKDFKLTLPNASTASFTGLVKNATNVSGGVDQVVGGSVSIKITGTVTYA
jgi:hypothetical protein